MRPHGLVALGTALAFCACEGQGATSVDRDGPAEVPGTARAELGFERDGKVVRIMSRAELEAEVPVEQWTAVDPYYGKPKTFRALPLAALLEKGFSSPAAVLTTYDYILRARDGYTVPLRGVRLFEPGGYVAVADVDVPGWEPIGRQRVNPGPFYVVWRERSQASLDTHPRPWQLQTIEIASFAATFPHTVPTGMSAEGSAMRGFRLFREQCVACHAINREGGFVGPDLNVPKNILEYRPEPQIRAYIRDPRQFRYSNMPAHPAFTPAQIDDLMEYLRAMKERKYDPDAAHPAGP